MYNEEDGSRLFVTVFGQISVENTCTNCLISWWEIFLAITYNYSNLEDATPWSDTIWITVI